METFLEQLASRQGRFEGRGVNHEDEPFTGRLLLQGVPGTPACAWDFLARLDSGVFVHVEHTILALDEVGDLGLWTVSSNRPRVARYALAGLEEARDGLEASFADGDPDDETRFRSRIRVELPGTGEVGIHHAWGLPGEAFAERSGLRMSAVG